jgi:hypothetical protein
MNRMDNAKCGGNLQRFPTFTRASSPKDDKKN